MATKIDRDRFEDLASEIENNMTADQCNDFWYKHQGGRGAKALGFTGTGSRTIVADLANFASNTGTAKRARLNGDIPTAKMYEDIADRIYKTHSIGRDRNPKPRKSRIPRKGVSKRAYVERPSQITRNPPTKRTRKRREQMTVLAREGYAGVFPNPRAGIFVEQQSGKGWRAVAIFPDTRIGQSDAEKYAKRIATGKAVRVVRK
jgi:hypothetical protein